MGTDDPPFFGPAEFMIEVEALAEVLTPAEVIESLTVGAARYLQIDERLGSIEPGKIADLVVVRGDPLSDLQALREVVVVLQGGEVVVDRR